MGAEQVSFARHRDDVGQLLDQPARGRQVVDDSDLAQQPHQRRTYAVGSGDDVDGVRRPRGQRGPVAVVEGGPTQEQPGAPEVVVLEVGDRRDRRGGVADHDGVGGGAEGGRDGGLVAVVDVEQRGHRAEQAVHAVGGGEQRTCAVLAVEPDLEGVAPRGEPGALAVGLLGVLAGTGQLLVDLVEDGDGLLVLGVEALLPRVEPGDAGLEGGEVTLGALGAGRGLLAGLA